MIHYMICATPRSGSTLLCEALRNTGLAGNPDEYFGDLHVERWQRQWQAADYLQRVLEYGAGSNGVWGAKVMRTAWPDFINRAGQEAFFPNLKYITITRRNKVRQAVSWLKMTQGVAAFWLWDHARPLNEPLRYQPEVIDDFLRQTAIHESAWLETFDQLSVQPFHVVYEDFVEAYEETALAILDFLEIERPPEIVFAERRLRKQADALSEQWVGRYLEEKGPFCG